MGDVAIAVEDGLGLLLLVWAVDVVDGDDGEVAVVTEVAKGDAGTGLGANLIDGLL